MGTAEVNPGGRHRRAQVGAYARARRCCCGAAAGHVADDDAPAAMGELDEVVEVAPDERARIGGVVDRPDLQLRPVRALGQEALLQRADELAVLGQRQVHREASDRRAVEAHRDAAATQHPPVGEEQTLVGRRIDVGVACEQTILERHGIGEAVLDLGGQAAEVPVDRVLGHHAEQPLDVPGDLANHELVVGEDGRGIEREQHRWHEHLE
jgi:hypothetical protein